MCDHTLIPFTSRWRLWLCLLICYSVGCGGVLVAWAQTVQMNPNRAPRLPTPEEPVPAILAGAFDPPPEYVGRYSPHPSPLVDASGRRLTEAKEWPARRKEILAAWRRAMGAWPGRVDQHILESLEYGQRDGLTQFKIKMEIAPMQFAEAYILMPPGEGPFPAVFVPFYTPEASVGLGKGKPLRDFAYQLARRGFVTLSLGSPGGSAWKPQLSEGAQCQPLSYLAYVAKNAWKVLASFPKVDPQRVGIMGHSYGGKWAMFGACLWEHYACAVWSDPGVIFDEARSNVNYWEPWYLGAEPGAPEKHGLITDPTQRTGAYRTLRAAGHDLHELQALMAPRPFLVSGGAEDGPERWLVLNHVRDVYRLLGVDPKARVGMTNRPLHDPNETSNEQIYAFLTYWLRPPVVKMAPSGGEKNASAEKSPP